MITTETYLDRSALREAFLEGFFAFERGDVLINPYSLTTLNGVSYQLGYLKARQQAAQQELTT